jgi:hypothetical protein
MLRNCSVSARVPPPGGTLQLPYSSVELWTERLRQSSGDDIVLVAVDGEEVVGSAGLHPEKSVAVHT